MLTKQTVNFGLLNGIVVVRLNFNFFSLNLYKCPTKL
jgi:hypothetical protein